LDLGAGHSAGGDNSLIESALAPSRESDAYRFTAAAGERIFFDMTRQPRTTRHTGSTTPMAAW
jgi:hypothetical protein